ALATATGPPPVSLGAPASSYSIFARSLTAQREGGQGRSPVGGQALRLAEILSLPPPRSVGTRFSLLAPSSRLLHDTAMDTGLEGKAALVGGASRGIGRAIALGLARAGASVALCARNQETLDKARDDIRNETGAEVKVVSL